MNPLYGNKLDWYALQARLGGSLTDSLDTRFEGSTWDRLSANFAARIRAGLQTGLAARYSKEHIK